MDSQELRFHCLRLAVEVLRAKPYDHDAVTALAESYYGFTKNKPPLEPINSLFPLPKFTDWFHGLPGIRRLSHIEAIIEAIAKNDKVVISRARQCGMTTLLAAYSLWRANQGSTSCLFVASHHRQVRSAIETMKKIIADSDLNPIKVTNNQVFFPQGGYISIGAVPVSLHGTQSDLTVLADAAFTDAETIEAVAAREGQIIMESSSRRGSHFDHFVSTASHNHSAFHTIMLPWWGLDESLHESIKKSIHVIGPEAFLQEYCCLIAR